MNGHRRVLQRLLALCLAVVVCCSTGIITPRADLESVSAPSAVLMEPRTGKVIWEKDSHQVRPPASITKIMTLILIFDALEEGKIKLDDQVTTSEYAASMGGSQVFLEPGETQTVDTMIKCIAVASANDACVCMAELISGSEEQFVAAMNERAKGLGMNDTNFVNCNGLDTEGHVTSAYDVALMSRELITKYPQIHEYSTIWMENITHTTAKGTKEFGLTNTNKLIRQYQYATGLKTGSTGEAKYCVSATAEKDGVEMIAVVMGAPDYKVRFADATAMLNYGFGKARVYTDTNEEQVGEVPVKYGVEESVPLVCGQNFTYMDLEGADLAAIEKQAELPQEAEAPITAGGLAGRVVYRLGEQEIGSVDVLYGRDVPRAGFLDCFWKVLDWCLI